MSQWTQDRQTISKWLNKKSNQDFTVKETAEFLLEAERQLRAEGFTSITWSYVSGCEDGWRDTEERALYVTGSRVATDSEQAEYELKCREQTIKTVKNSIESLSKDIISNERKLVELNFNLNRFNNELESNPNRKSDIKSVSKAITRREQWIVDLKEKQKIYEPLLSLPDDEMVEEYRRLDKEEYEKKYGNKTLA